MRGTLIAGCLAIVYAGAARVVTLGHGETGNGAGSIFAFSAALALIVAIIMFFIALFTLFVARATDRAIGQFRKGESLADWSFTPSEWDAFLASEQVRRTKTGRWVILLAIVGPIALVLAIVGWLLAPDVWISIANVALVAGGSAAVVRLILQMSSALDRRHFAMMRRNPRVLIGKTAIYCGGVFTLWGIGMTALQRIRMVAGSPMMLEVTIGAGKTAQTASTLAAFALVLADDGAAGSAALSNTTSRSLIPVPSGREEEAAQVAQALLQPPRASAQPTVGLESAPGSVQGRAQQGRPGTMSPKRSRHWWAITAGMLGSGLVFFVAAPGPQGDPGVAHTGLGTAMDVLGLLLWTGSIPTATAAVVASVRHRRDARSR